MQINSEIIKCLSIGLQNFEDQRENEFRFGKKENNKFVPGVSKAEFDRVFNFIKSFAKYSKTELTHTIDHLEGRARLYLQGETENLLLFPWEDNVIITKKEFIKKEKKETIDIDEYSIRFSSSIEKEISSEILISKGTYFKTMKRFIFYHGYFKIELSIFKASNNETDIGESETNFDIEIEILAKPDINELIYFLSNIVKAIQFTDNLMKVGESNYVLDNFQKMTKSPKYFGVQPVPVRSEKIDLAQEYSVSLKLDGVRKLLIILNSKIYCLDSKQNIISTGIVLKNEKFDNSIFDCEHFKEVYHIFDIFFSNKIDLRRNTEYFLKKRLSIVEEFVKELNHATILSKKHHFGNSIYNLSVKLLSKDFTKDIDGIIYTPVSQSYPLKKNDPGVPLKWKPENMNTIDFFIKKENSDPLFDSWILSVYNTTKNIIFEVEDYPDIHKIRVSKEVSNKFKDLSIVECYFDKSVNSFVPLRNRTDKTRPNHVSVALDNFDLTVSPFDIENLNKSKKRNNTYFFDMRRFHNWIKRSILDEYSVKNGSGGHLDLACGKGGDIFKWGDNSIRYTEGYDICTESILIAKERSRKLTENPIYKNMTYNFYQKDLAKETIDTDNTFDTVSCFFAIHYFFKDISSLYTLLSNTKNLKIGGHFMMSCFCNEKLSKYDYNIANSKFRIENKKFDKGSKFGNSIDVFLEDTVLNKSTTEFIVDYRYLIDVMEQQGFKIVETKLFEDYYSEWSENNNYLNNTSKLFSFLNRVFIFQKVSQGDYQVPETLEVPEVPLAKKEFRFQEIDFCELETYPMEELKVKKISELKEIGNLLGLPKGKYNKKELIDFIFNQSPKEEN